MPLPDAPVFRCERCGTSYGRRSERTGCLFCLLQGGLSETDPDFDSRGPDLQASGDPPPNLSAPRFYQHYEILTREDGSPWELGRGAMGVTYKARDVNLRIPVALKVINARYSEQPSARAHFLREARAAARLRHPNVASVFHFGTAAAGSAGAGAEAGDCFYAMEFVDGETLEARLQRTGPLPSALAVEIALQITRALMAAEARGLVHRDLKPANVMLVAGDAAGLRPSGSAGEAWVKVIDFGLAKAVSVEAMGDSAFLAEPAGGGFVGTPHFSSPEQFTDSGSVDVRSDIFSLGVTLWYLLTGTLPFDGKSVSEVQDLQRSRSLPTALLADAQTPTPLVALLESMLAADPARRPASAEALHGALEECLRALRLSSPPPRRPAKVRRRLALAGAAALVAGLLASAAHLSRSASRPPQPTKTSPTEPAAIEEKSIAILPLENQSEDKDDAFFAVGIQDDALASLARIRDLKVIGRSSVAKYKAGEPRDLPAIGRQLGVAHVVEGSVRRTGGRVIVAVGLIDARDGRQRWGERYDRTVADAAALQGTLAADIARELRVNLTLEERASVARLPTDNAQAYELYLRARDYDTRPGFLLINNQQAIGLYSQAIALDPKFALARARLAVLMATLYNNDALPAGEKDRIRVEADEAARSQPDLGEAHVARALVFSYIDHDSEGALRELATAGQKLPNDGSVAFYSAIIQRKLGRPAEAVAAYEKAARQVPRNGRVTAALFETAASLRDWPRAARAAERTAELTPELPFARLDRAYIEFWRAGDLSPLRAALAAIPASVDPVGGVTLARLDLALLERDAAAAERILAESPLDEFDSYGLSAYSKGYLRGCIALMAGEKTRAHELFEAARPGLEATSTPGTQDAYYHATLSGLYSFLDRHADAIREARQACELMPLSSDAGRWSAMRLNLAMIHARAGDTDRALYLLENLLTMPAAMSRSPVSLSQHDLRRRWQWDELRADPRFQKLLTGPEPKLNPRTSSFPLP